MWSISLSFLTKYLPVHNSTSGNFRTLYSILMEIYYINKETKPDFRLCRLNVYMHGPVSL